MIIGTVSFMVAPGKNPEAMKYFHEVVREAKRLTGAELRILTQLGGPLGHVVISGQYETITAWNEMREKLSGDASFQKRVTEAGKDGLLIPGTTTSALWQQI